MGLKEIKSAGAMAARLTEAAQAMLSINNTYRPKYDELLAAIRAALGATKTMGGLTDAEVNSFFFGGLGDATAVANAQTIIKEWEKNITSLAGSVVVLPANDI
jgi:hypothetical protein